MITLWLAPEVSITAVVAVPATGAVPEVVPMFTRAPFVAVATMLPGSRAWS